MTSSSKLSNYKIRLRRLQQQCTLKDYTIIFHFNANNETIVFKQTEQDAVVAYIWAWLYYAYVKFVMCMRNMWVVQWYCVFKTN